MSTSPQGHEPRPARSPDDALPPVSPPSTTFLLQLFFIPLLIVAIIVTVWLLFSWLAHAGNDPKDLVRDIKRFNNASWQKAHTLADMLRNREYDYLKRDSSLALEIANLLDSELELAQLDPGRLQLRVFLCKALGEFQITDGVNALIRATAKERSPEEAKVRIAAVEALALLANNVGPEQLRLDTKLVDALVEASAVRTDVAEQKETYDRLRSSAAFALGVIGGETALARLERMLDDSKINVRYNAAVGLARHGDLRAKPVLLEMMDPKNEAAVEEEKNDASRDVKRALVQITALQATDQYWRTSAQKDDQELVAAVQKLAAEGASQPVKNAAKETLEHKQK